MIPRDLLAETEPGHTELVGAKDLARAMENLSSDVKDRLALAHQRQKTYYDARTSEASLYKPGDLVLIFRPQWKKGRLERHQYAAPTR